MTVQSFDAQNEMHHATVDEHKTLYKYNEKKIRNILKINITQCHIWCGGGVAYTVDSFTSYSFQNAKWMNVCIFRYDS